MAQAYPDATFVGFDYHEPSVQRARELADESGLGERVIYRELFPKGLTLLDLQQLGEVGIAHVTARQELREMIAGLQHETRLPAGRRGRAADFAAPRTQRQHMGAGGVGVLQRVPSRDVYRRRAAGPWPAASERRC